MKNSILVGVLATSLLPLALGSTSASADYFQKTITCPASNVVLVAGGEGQIRISDMVISATDNTDFILKYFGEDKNRTVLKLWLKSNTTVVDSNAASFKPKVTPFTELSSIFYSVKGSLRKTPKARIPILHTLLPIMVY